MKQFKIRETKNKHFYFVLKARNGKAILIGETHPTFSACEKGIRSVIMYAKMDHQFQEFRAHDGSFYFNLRARNGDVIGTSEMYKLESSMKKGIASVQKTLAGM